MFMRLFLFMYYDGNFLFLVDINNLKLVIKLYYGNDMKLLIGFVCDFEGYIYVVCFGFNNVF